VPLVILVTVIAALAALWVSARAAVTVCLLEITAGKVRVVRGGLAPGVLSDIADVVARPTVERATLRIERDRGHARLDLRGSVPSDQQQRLRNVIGSVPLAALARTRRR
jgi:hypothetical protein